MDNQLVFTEKLYKRPVLSRTFTKEDSGEFVIPDTEPDALRVVFACAAPYIRTKEAAAGRVSVSGVTELTVIYVPEGGKELRRVTSSVPFASSCEGEEISEFCQVAASVECAQCDGRIINSRKLGVHVELIYRIQVYSDGKITLPTGFSEPEGKETLTETLRLCLPACVTEKTVSLTDSPSAGGIAQVLASTVCLRNEDVRVVGAKAVVRGAAVTKSLCTMKNGEAEMVTTESPYSQVMELEGEMEGAIFNVTAAPTGLYVSLEQDTLSIEVHAVLQLTAYEKSELSYIKDAYISGMDSSIETESLTLDSLTGFESLPVEAAFSFGTPEKVRSIAAVRALGGAPSVEDGALTVPMSGAVVFTNEAGEYFGSVRRGTAQYAKSLDSGFTWEPVGFYSEDEKAEYNRTEEGIAARTSGLVTCARYKKETAQYVVKLTGREQESCGRCPSIIACRAGENTTLWELGKHYSVALGDILSANGMAEGQEPTPGQLLIIPVKMKKQGKSV